jgi:hypothetical protein
MGTPFYAAPISARRLTFASTGDVFSERGGLGIWTIDPIIHPLVDQQLYRFVVEMQIGVRLSLQRDVMGPSFGPKEITLTYPRADDFRLVEASTGCKLRFEQPANQFIFDRHWMEKPAARQPDNLRRRGQAVRQAFGGSFVAYRGYG